MGIRLLFSSIAYFSVRVIIIKVCIGQLRPEVELVYYGVRKVRTRAGFVCYADRIGRKVASRFCLQNRGFRAS